MVSGDHGDPTVCVPGPVVVVHAAHLESATDLSKATEKTHNKKALPASVSQYCELLFQTLMFRSC